LTPAPRRLLQARLLLVLLPTLLVYTSSLDNGFVFDDRGSVQSLDPDRGVEQEMVATLRPLPDYFTSHYLRGAAPTSRGYRPITVLSWALTYRFLSKPLLPEDWPGSRNGLDPEQQDRLNRLEAMPHHAINVLLQVLNTWLVLLILRRFCPGWPAILGALVFGVHALHTEVVANIVGRGELLGFGFGAAALLFYLGGVDKSNKARALHFTLTGLLLGLAFFSKESALAWLLFLPVVRIAQHQPGLKRDIVHALLLAAVPAILFLWLRSIALDGLPDYRTSFLTNPIHQHYEGHMTRILTAITVWGYSIYKVLWPFSLSIDYGANVFALARSLADFRVWVMGILLLGLVAGGFIAVRKHPLLFLAMACYFGFSFVASNLPFAQETIYAERNYYTPSLAVSVIVGWIAARPLQQPLRVGLLVCLGLWVAGSCVMDVRRMGDWESDEALFLNDVRVQPRSLRLLDTAASVHLQRNELDKYRALVEQELVVEPEYPKALLKLAHHRILDKDYQAASKLLQRCQASRLYSLHNAAENRSRLAFHNGQLHQATGNTAEAMKMFQAAVEADPEFYAGHQYLIRVYLQHQQLDAALDAIGTASKQFPGDPGFQLARGRVLFLLQRFSEAEAVLLSVLRGSASKPPPVEPSLDLIEAILRQGRKAEAMRRLDSLLRMHGGEVAPEHRGRVQKLRRG
jgi:tetratricopeptide (TPR) repeat protein